MKPKKRKSKKERKERRRNHGDENNHNGENGRRITKHHVIPRSRGGANNTVKIPERYHVAWHTFFGNLTPKEAIYFIRVIFSKNGKQHGKWTMQDLYDLQLRIQKRNDK